MAQSWPWVSQIAVKKKKKTYRALQALDLPDKTLVYWKNYLRLNNTINFETKSTLEVFKNYYSTLADNLLKKFPNPANKY